MAAVYVDGVGIVVISGKASRNGALATPAVEYGSTRMHMRKKGLARALVLSSVLGLALGACGGGKGTAGAVPQTAGSRVYMQYCIGCHGPAGKGMGLQPALPGSATVNGDPTALTAWVVFGIRPATTPAGKYPGMMPQFSYLKDEELAAVLTHIRSQWGNQASPLVAADIAAVRATHGAP